MFTRRRPQAGRAISPEACAKGGQLQKGEARPAQPFGNAGSAPSYKPPQARASENPTNLG